MEGRPPTHPLRSWLSKPTMLPNPQLNGQVVTQSVAEATAEMSNSEFLPTKREKQQITVPFCWEEKPGRPKTVWSLNSPQSHSVPPATTIAASVPFKWEEKPGTPFREFAKAMPSPLCASAAYTASISPAGYCCKDKRTGSNPFVDDEDDLIKAVDVASCIRPKLSAEDVPAPLCAPIYPINPSPVGNRKHGVKGINPFTDDEVDHVMEVTEVSTFDTEKSESNENPTDSSAKSEAWYSDTTSEMGDDDAHSNDSNVRKSEESISVLEFLFPLSSPEVSFLNEVWYREKVCAGLHQDPAAKNSENQCKFVAKRGPTLGELIMLNRKLSRARQDPVRKGNHGLRLARWHEIVRQRVRACGVFGSSVINRSITLDASHVKYQPQKQGLFGGPRASSLL